MNAISSDLNMRRIVSTRSHFSKGRAGTQIGAEKAQCLLGWNSHTIS
jgi:hypothetical protein